MWLVGDIGGTKTLLASAVPNSGLGSSMGINNVKSYKSYSYEKFDLILKDYLMGLNNNEIKGVALAVAGPVTNNYSKLTNLDWLIDAKSIKKQINVNNILVYNDLEAIAAAVCNDDSSLDIMPIKAVDTFVDSNHYAKAIIAPGTGLGMSYAVYNEGRYLPLSSQGGHVSFAPRTLLQQELLIYIHKRIEEGGKHKYNQVSLELVCSGIGIPNIFKFFKEYKKISIDNNLLNQIQNSEDWVPVIINNAISNRCEACVRTVDLFIEILAIAVQNMALTINALGGIYLAGGIAVALKDYLLRSEFLDRVIDNRTMFESLDKTPVNLCQNKYIALIGAGNLLELK